MNPNFNHSHHRQAGIVLVVALIMLVIMTLLGLSGIRTVVLEEKMTASARDRSLAFQAAETALRAAEEDALGRPIGIRPAKSDGQCNESTLIAKATTGYINQSDVDCSPDWTQKVTDSNWSAHAKAVTTNTLAGNASYIIEFMGNDFTCDPTAPSDDNNYCSRYRITARANPGTGRADVMLQSIYFAR
ncbi:MAG: pilus assembly protein [Betaproteobacteria bacterium HGW-Betaproteobacteria-6]|jgi:type IV pilus assembly protein PilX|nr:MAG: pilus assembly protein [Betaproteobacteria bacterium HGW-Betaproteobacteria-6]PKO88055.1 MAG: pilus assembly protein [Betaproteobacteria bacterium HGW-Betaproteobacteria-10]